jgi:hypothetical protein
MEKVSSITLIDHIERNRTRARDFLHSPFVAMTTGCSPTCGTNPAGPSCFSTTTSSFSNTPSSPLCQPAPNVPCVKRPRAVPSLIHPLSRSSVSSSNDPATMRVQGVRSPGPGPSTMRKSRWTASISGCRRPFPRRRRPSMGALQVELSRDLRQLPPDDRDLNHPPRRERFAALTAKRMPSRLLCDNPLTNAWQNSFAAPDLLC